MKILNLIAVAVLTMMTVGSSAFASGTCPANVPKILSNNLPPCQFGDSTSTTWYWENGSRANYGDAWYWENGTRANFGDTWYWNNGARANYGDTWYYKNGTRVNY